MIAGNVVDDPVDSGSDVPAPVIPSIYRVPLHRDDDEAILDAPATDVVVEGVGFANLLLYLVASASAHVDEQGAIGTHR